MWATRVSTDVTSTQFAVLSVVADNPDTDQNTIAREASLDTSTTADVVNRLVAHGFLARIKDPNDRRRNLLSLTAHGSELFEEISVTAARMTDELVACLPAHDRRELVRLLQRVVSVGEARTGKERAPQ
ncbi:MarR family winged helix-turn-helix transcriptional regulator [Mycolicibacterium septicum]|nr:MarR family winged helix-turn-helix transcriptional regulator [Mycolicibacterium septicum]MDF3337112.1 MarR family winged helix-turn-helix transcriptional regulator [Mycolicibacterium septicum]